MSGTNMGDSRWRTEKEFDRACIRTVWSQQTRGPHRVAPNH